ncbi:hypothetical protein DPMN_069018 [Dreissena polymorpha]|uniref:G-protein coupled receptors family 1 profile domain-containing protein n=1 Tax=Dreissena polymorpha TaxID=45954 RepID=A0A9D3Z0S3_DREPO|nr:hypothetical protein DPMN_069018 [Dreissena polymorpha]
MDEINITLHNSKYRCCCVINSESIDYADENTDEECGPTKGLADAETRFIPTNNASGNHVIALDEEETLATPEILVESRPTFSNRDRRFNKAPFSKKDSNTLVRNTVSGIKCKEKHKRKITRMMLTITIVFIVTYLPFMVLSVVTTLVYDFWDGLPGYEEVLYDSILRLYLLNNIANPIIYSFMDVKFIREVASMFKGIFRCSIFENQIIIVPNKV